MACSLITLLPMWAVKIVPLHFAAPFNLKLTRAIKRTSALFAAPIKYGQERVYPHILCCPFSLNMGRKECTLSCLKSGGRHRQNLAWGYTQTLPPFFRALSCLDGVCTGIHILCLTTNDINIINAITHVPI